MKTWIICGLALLGGIWFGFARTVMELGGPPAGQSDMAGAAEVAEPAVAGTNPPARVKPVPEGQPQPVAVVEKSTTFDFGTVEAGTKGSHTFTLRNAGKGTLHLAKGASSCSCTIAKLSSTEISPGQAADVVIKWSVRNTHGRFHKTVQVHTNDRRKQTITFIIAGQVYQAVRAVPHRLTFPNLSPRDKAEKEFRVYSHKDADFRITGHKFSRPKEAGRFDVSYAPIPAEKLDEPGAKYGYIVTFRVKPGMEAGRFDNRLVFETTPKQKTPVGVSIWGYVKKDVSIIGIGWDEKAGTYTMRANRKGELQTAKLEIQIRGANREKVGCKVSFVNPGFLRVELGKPTDNKHGKYVRIPLTIAVPRGAALPNTPGLVLIDTTHPEIRQLRVNIHFPGRQQVRELAPPAAGEPQPRVVVDEPNFDFGTMKTEQEGTHKFRIKNAGKGILNLKVGEPPCSCTVGKLAKTALSPGETAELTVNWSTGPRYWKDRRFVVPVHTNDPNKFRVELTVKGTVISTYHFEPQTFSLSGLTSGETREVEARLFYFGDGQLEIKGHKIADEKWAGHMDVSCEPLPPEKVEELHARSGYLVKLKVKKGIPTGWVSTKLVFDTSPAEKQQVGIPIYGTISPELAISGYGFDKTRMTLTMRSNSKGEIVPARLMIFARGPQRDKVALKVARVEPASLRAQLGERTESGKPNSTFQHPFVKIPLSVEVQGDARPAGEGQVVIETTHPEIKELKFAVRFP